jgi:hypothetical protein
LATGDTADARVHLTVRSADPDSTIAAAGRCGAATRLFFTAGSDQTRLRNAQLALALVKSIELGSTGTSAKCAFLPSPLHARPRHGQRRS